jgi:hypothetical protein
VIKLTLKSQFLKIPLLENISEVPTHPYIMAHEGMLHSSKVVELIKIIKENQSNKSRVKSIQNLLGDHKAVNIIELELDEIADWIRHLCYLNKNELGWDNCDTILTDLSKKFIPRWEFPKFKLDLRFRSLLRTMIDWNISDKDRVKLEVFFEEIKNQNHEFFDFSEINQTLEAIKLNHPSLKNITFLYETMNVMANQTDMITSNISHLINYFDSLFETLIQDSKDIDDKIILSCIHLNSLLKTSDLTLLFVEEKLIAIWDMINSLKGNAKDEYMWLYGMLYSSYCSKILFFEKDILNRRFLVFKLIHNFITPRSVNLEIWSSYLLNRKLHPWLFAYISQGYGSLLKILEQYSEDIIASSESSYILELHGNISKFLSTFMMKYLAQQSSGNFNDYFLNPEFINNFEKLLLLPGQLQILKEMLILSIKHSILHRNVSEEELPEYLNYASKAINAFLSEDYRFFFQLDLMMSFDDLPFDGIASKILEESIKEGHLFLGNTFENEIIKPFSRMFSFIQTNQRYESWSKLYCMEIVFWYISEWFIKLVSYEEIDMEVILLLSPFVTTIMILMTRTYFQNNLIKRGYLMLLNNHLFQLVTELPNDYPSFIKDHKIDNILKINQDLFKEVFSLIRGSSPQIKEISVMSSSIGKDFEGFTATTITEDLVNYYLEIRDELNNSLNEIDKLRVDQITNFILNNSPFHPPIKSSLNNLMKIGSLNPLENVKKVPFPVIRNLNVYTLALELFPIEIDLSQLEKKYIPPE